MQGYHQGSLDTCGDGSFDVAGKGLTAEKVPYLLLFGHQAVSDGDQKRPRGPLRGNISKAFCERVEAAIWMSQG